MGDCGRRIDLGRDSRHVRVPTERRVPRPRIGVSFFQRIWSNESAAAGHDPCKPLAAGGGAVLRRGSYPSRMGTQADPFGYTQGVSIEPGSEVTIPVVRCAPLGRPRRRMAGYRPRRSRIRTSSPDVYGELSFSWDKAPGRAREYPLPGRSSGRSLPTEGSRVFLRVGDQLHARVRHSHVLAGRRRRARCGGPVVHSRAWL